MDKGMTWIRIDCREVRYEAKMANGKASVNRHLRWAHGRYFEMEKRFFNCELVRVWMHGSNREIVMNHIGGPSENPAE